MIEALRNAGARIEAADYPTGKEHLGNILLFWRQFMKMRGLCDRRHN